MLPVVVLVLLLPLPASPDASLASVQRLTTSVNANRDALRRLAGAMDIEQLQIAVTGDGTGVAARDALAYKLLSLGYSAHETADIVAGRISKQSLDQAHAMRMAGRSNDTAADYLDREYRGSFDKAKRTASGYDATTSIGLQADESERESTRGGVDLELTPNDKMSFTLAWARHNNDYPNRPNRSAVAAGTVNGLLNAKYDTYTVEADFTPMERADFGLYYTYEKDFSRTQTGGTGTVAATALASLLTFDGSAKGDTYGAYATFTLVPDRLVFDFNAKRAKVDGLMDITGDPTGSFALARVAYGGIQDITDYNDTDWTTMTAQFKFTFNKDWGLNLGWMYDKYTIADAYSIFGNQTGAGQFDYGNEVFPESGGFYLKANDGNYKANIFFVKLSKKF